MAGSKIRVSVVKNGDDFFVQPAVVNASEGDSLRIINNTDEDLVFFIGDPAALKLPGDQVKPVKANKKDKIELAASVTDNNRYTFQIFMASGKKAMGNSDPVLIIDN